MKKYVTTNVNSLQGHIRVINKNLDLEIEFHLKSMLLKAQ